MTAKPEEVEKGREPVNRREFLNLAWLASLGFLTVSMGGAVYLFALPRFKEGEFGGVVTIGRVSDLPEVGSSPENYPKLKFWLSSAPEGLSALYKVCTHLGCLYNWNTQEIKFICPCHGSQFEEDGDFITGPAPRSLDHFVVRIIDPNTGEVLAETTGPNPIEVPDDPNAIVQVDTGKRIPGEPHA